MSEELTRDELVKILGEQIELLQLNAELFDKGHTVTTLSMATTMRVLFHDTDKCVSLIKHICDAEGKDKSEFEMITTKEQNASTTEINLFGDCLYGLACSEYGFAFFPKLNESTHTKIPFDSWWREGVIKNVDKGFDVPIWLSREALITLHANKEGGAHVDKYKNKKVSEITKKESAGFEYFVICKKGVSKEVDCAVDPKRASIRQVCYEVLVSLNNHFPELFKRDYC